MGALTQAAVFDDISHDVNVLVPPSMYTPPPCKQRADQQPLETHVQKHPRGAMDKEGRQRGCTHVKRVIA